MRILAIDPAMTCTGWAVMYCDAGDITLEDCGTIRPRKKDLLWRRWMLTHGVRRELTRWEPENVVVEIPSPKGSFNKVDRGASLVTYGMAVGIVLGCLAEMWDVCAFRMHPIEVNTWTKHVPKTQRAKVVAAQFPYWADRIKANKTLDIADAIGLGWWWLRRQEIKSRLTEVAGKRKDSNA